MSVSSRYKDFHAWTIQQAYLLRNQRLEEIDWQDIADEIEEMGRSEKRQLESRLEILIIHLLKWQFQPNFRSRSWQLTVKEQRLRIERLLEENPSLKTTLDDMIAKIYPIALIGAERETGLSCFPESCIYSLTELLNQEFLPE